MSENDGVAFTMFRVILVLCWSAGKTALVKLRSVAFLRAGKVDAGRRALLMWQFCAQPVPQGSIVPCYRGKVLPPPDPNIWL